MARCRWEEGRPHGPVLDMKLKVVWDSEVVGCRLSGVRVPRVSPGAPGREEQGENTSLQGKGVWKRMPVVWRGSSRGGLESLGRGL